MPVQRFISLIFCVALVAACGEDEKSNNDGTWYQPWSDDKSAESMVIGTESEPQTATTAEPVDEPIDEGEDDIVLEFELDKPGMVEVEPESENLDANNGRIVTIEVRRGETIKLYKKWSGIPIDELRALNEMGTRKNLRIGQTFKLLLAPDVWRNFQEQRETHFTKLELSFFDKYDVKDLRKYTVRKGDNIWKIAAKYENVPVWVLEKLNKNMNLAKLSVGDQILIPVLADLKTGKDSPAAKLWANSGQEVATRPTTRNSRPSAPPQVQHHALPQAKKVAASEPMIQGVTIKVGRNETLGHYARWTQVSVKTIISANPGINPNRIGLGQKIKLPVAGAALANFYEKRRRFNGTPAPKAFLEAKKALKQGAKPNVATVAAVAPTKAAPPVAIPKAQDLKAATNTASAAPVTAKPKFPKARSPLAKKEFKKHVVARGENAWKIATKRYGITLLELRNANPNINIERLHVGATLRIPVHAAAK